MIARIISTAAGPCSADQEARLAVADAVLARAGAAVRERALDQAGVELLGAGDVLGIVGVDQHAGVEVAIADVADDRGGKTVLGDVRLRRLDAVGQRGDRHAHVGGHPGFPGHQRPRRVVGPVTGVPQPSPLLFVGGPGEVTPSVLGGEDRRLARLAGDVLFGDSVELEEQGRRDRKGRLVVAVNGLDLERVGQLDPCHRDRVLGDLHHAAHRVGDGREGAGGRHRGRGDRVDAERNLADQSERALRTHHQPGQVIAGRRLTRAGMRTHHLAAAVDHRHPEYVLAHRPVAHGHRARRAGGHHPADRRVRARVDSEEDSLLAELGVERTPRRARPAPRRRDRRGRAGRWRSSRACRR